MSQSANISRHLPEMAKRHPDTPALKVPRGRTAAGAIDYLTLTFSELDREVDAWGLHLRSKGVQPGDKVLLMVRQGLPLIAGVFALFKLGAVPVVIDPGMGLGSFLRCVEHTQPDGLLGIPAARVLSRVFFGKFRSLKYRIGASADPLARIQISDASGRLQPLERASTDLAAILFTSGSTGFPKGVCYEHGMFEAQVALIRDTYSIQPGEIDLPMLPIFALFNPALGMTTVVPEIDPSRPAQVDPEKIVRAILQENVTNSFGSPTLWNKISVHCSDRGIALPSLKRVLCAGAPVPAGLWERSRAFLPNGWLHSPYGATESLPISSIRADEVDTKSVRGACVGKPVAGIEVRIIQPEDGPVESIARTRLLGPGEVGEIIVRGPVVTKNYYRRDEATALAKIPDGALLWHRMGDMGFLDTEGKLWFCGRKVEAVGTSGGLRQTEPVEQVFRSHPLVVRCALIGIGEKGAQRPALAVQASRPQNKSSAYALACALRSLAREHPHTKDIHDFYFHPAFPVDVRHNAKIHRLTLARWAAKQTPVTVHEP